MKLWWGMNIKGEEGGEMAGNISSGLQSGCAVPRWSRADGVSITNVAPFFSALNQSELEFSGLIYIFFSLQDLALFSTNSMLCSRNCKSNEGRGFLNRAWDALAKLWGTSHSTCLGCSWQHWELMGFPFPDLQMKTWEACFKEAAPIARLTLASKGWCLRGKRNHPFLFIVTSLPKLHSTSGPLILCRCLWCTLSSFHFSPFVTYPPLMLPPFKIIIA